MPTNDAVGVSTILPTVAAALRRLVAAVASLLPTGATNDPPPDIDGRREGSTDAAEVQAQLLRKDGHGGYN